MNERDFAFAKKYNIRIKVVIASPDWKGEELTQPILKTHG